ncbi:MAG: hypothetical protein ACJAUC_004725, partial [Planctomycetota bacterium]
MTGKLAAVRQLPEVWRNGWAAIRLLSPAEGEDVVFCPGTVPTYIS